ncbi:MULTISPECIES: ABC transporter permease [Marinomonas]|jgi:monosaccharide ABC transporter membrane protein, CUT2 family (TC 3.A.1.2.-)|uniref:ABC-type transporter, integral membrane subunit n=2 Tax=Marinomonas TaxID=28253 RepID=F2JZM1_MARM1|nr:MULTISPECIES: ABC transporter permease [Marinomonas]ADZ90875.1 ABC-type transporter, integral membrane subunit [Marinomonas mediterranea MMB-1]TDO99763.1 monosaccharide ABC transporter membrane protein (CUT2 family) [Marinomonas balearica]WCN08923.1 ABC transporter permease [Marinomonas mediterranea]WCN17024.1 ABC transporter permease [Marinomonas mediterranea MMB-1]
MMRSRQGAPLSLGGTSFSFISGSTGPLIGLLLLCAFLSFSTESFFSLRNFVNILDQITVLGILAVGMTFVILIGGIDLSVGSVLALAGMVMGYLAKEAGWPMGSAILFGLIVAGMAGLVSGLLIAFFRVPAFIATLAMMSAARGLANMVTDGHQIISFPIWFNLMAVIRYGGVITITVGIMLAIFLICWAYLKFTSGGRSLYAIGGNAEVARLAGIKVKLHTVGVYVFAAVLSGVAGVLLGARLDSVQPQAGVSYELDAIAAVVIGGTSLSGGTGSLVGTIIGVLIIGVLRNGLNLLGVSPFMQQVVIGFVIALAVAIEALKKR